MPSKYKAFISYRRSDSSARAQLVKLSLMQQGYNDKDIFLDLHSIHEGEFPDRIREALYDTEFFILLISKNSFVQEKEKIKEHEKREKDFYLEEINIALDLHLKVIPVLFDFLKVEDIALPECLEKKHLKLKNSISYYDVYSNTAMEKIAEFMKPKKTTIWNFLKMPLLILTLYAAMTILSGICMYVHDNFFMSDEEQIATMAENVQVGDGKLVYQIPEKTYIYDTARHTIHTFEGRQVLVMGGSISGGQITRLGFWTVSMGLVYELSHSRLKPHGNSKSVLAYVAVCASVVVGVGLGCTLERMLFPKRYSRLITKSLDSTKRWEEVTLRKFSRSNTFFIE